MIKLKLFMTMTTLLIMSRYLRVPYLCSTGRGAAVAYVPRKPPTRRMNRTENVRIFASLIAARCMNNIVAIQDTKHYTSILSNYFSAYYSHLTESYISQSEAPTNNVGNTVVGVETWPKETLSNYFNSMYHRNIQYCAL